MRSVPVMTTVALAVSATTAAAIDLLPLKTGVYVRQGTPCKGAPRSDVIAYWGKADSINSPQVECSITKLDRTGTRFTVLEKCREIASNAGQTYDQATELVIPNPTTVNYLGTTYRWCGKKLAF